MAPGDINVNPSEKRRFARIAELLDELDSYSDLRAACLLGLTGRRRSLFACELDMHAGRLEAWRLPSLPPGHPQFEQARQARGRHMDVSASI